MENLKELISREEIEKRLSELARELDTDYQGKEIVALCVMRGSVFFAIELTLKMKTKMKFEFITLSSYTGEEKLNIATKYLIPKQIEKHGFEVLNGKGKVIGELYGGCIESLYDAYTGERHGDDNEIYTKYNLLPTLDEWKEKILFRGNEIDF